jgi:hypothetical protein
MSDKRLLLISNQPEDVTFLAEASQIAGATLEVMPDAKKAAEAIATLNPIAIFIDVNDMKLLNSFEMEAQKRFGLFSDQVQASRFHFIGNRPLQENRDVIQSPFFGSYYERPTSKIEENGQMYGRFVLAGEQMQTHDLKNFLSDRGKVQTVTLVRSDQKQEAAEAVRQYLIQAKIPGRIANTVANAVDELLMNALFDAPADEFGKSLYESTDRSQARELKEREVVKMTIGFDGFYVGVSIADFFGSIDRTRLLNHISMNYREKEYSVRRGLAGAGLGLAAVFNSGGSLIYHCENGNKTEVTLLYRAFDNFREFKSQFRFFSAKFYV